MKTVFTSLLFLAGISLSAQTAVPNGGFESWTSGDPNGWTTSNNNSQSLVNVTQVSNAHSGSSAVRMDTWSLASYWFGAILICPNSGNFFPLTTSTQPASLKGWYISNFVSGDKLSISTALEQNGSGVAGGTLDITNNTSVYQQFSLPLVYSPSNAMPDSATIAIGEYTATGGTTGLHPGTYVILDDIDFSATTATNDLETSNGIEKIYPNPSNGNSWMEYSLKSTASVSAGVYDVNGNLVQSLVAQDQQPGRYRVAINAAALAQGLYIVRLQAGENYSSMTFSVAAQ